MYKNKMDKSGTIIIKICIFSIVLSITALILCAVFDHFSSQNKSVLNEKILPTIIIDAGHGGEDGGAVAADGTMEKNLNLLVASKVACILKASGYPVLMTRSNDSMLYTDPDSGSKKMQDLRERINIANSAEDGIFVSIHMNKFSQEKYSGLQVFFSKNDSKSRDLANCIQNTVKNTLQSENNRESKPAGSNIYILENIEIPAVLVECGFLSNPEECALLNSEDYRKELACAISLSLIEFFSGS